jgi:signal transduction histidine kinase
MFRRAVLLSAASAIPALLPFRPAMADDAAADRATAKTLVEEAVAMVAKDGLEATRPLLDAEGHFHHDEFYVVMLDFNGIYLVVPTKPALEGTNMLDAKDADGKMLVRDMIRIAKDDGEGWAEYRWLNPVAKKIQPKVSFVKRVAGHEMFAACGVYK